MLEITHLHTLVGSAVVFTALGVWLGPKVRNWWHSVPASVQATLKTVETNLVARLKEDEGAVIATFHTANGLPVPGAMAKVPTPVAVPAPADTVDHHPV